MFKNKNLAFKLSVFILVPVILVFLVTFTYNFTVSRDIIEGNAKTNAEYLSKATANEIDQVFMMASKAAENLAHTVESCKLSNNELEQYLQDFVEDNREVFGSCVAFEANAFDKKRQYYAPYAYKKDGGVALTNLGTESYNYFKWDWYKLPKQQHKTVWSEPYFDDGGGNVLMATYSVPFYREIDGKKQFWGIATVDISLAWLKRIFSTIRIYKSGYSFLISKKGTIVAHPSSELVMKESVFSLADKRQSTELREFGQLMVDGKSGFFPFHSDVQGMDGFIYFTPLKSNKWAIATFFPADELFAADNELKRNIVFITIAGIIVLLVLIITVSNYITGPLRKLAGVATVIGKGDFDIALPVNDSKDEIGMLTSSFKEMRQQLMQYIENLKVTTSAKEKIESELRIAHDIQMSIIPNLFPAFPEREEFDVYATLVPAKEVGGDLYDFFFIDDDHLCFAIGDVSGKGVPASLFMAITRTLLRAKSLGCLDPGKIVSQMNHDLCEDNDSAMFVTFFLAIMNVNTGELKFTNAGHNPSIIVKQNGDEHCYLRQIHGIPLGIFCDDDYGYESITLSENDTIVCYTDGVTEATNRDLELYGDPRLESLLFANRDCLPDVMAHKLLDDVMAFQSDAEQADDITILILKKQSLIIKQTSEDSMP